MGRYRVGQGRLVGQKWQKNVDVPLRKKSRNTQIKVKIVDINSSFAITNVRQMCEVLL